MVVFTIFELIQVDFVCLLSRCLLPNMSDTTQKAVIISVLNVIS
jgi:hypothetical protein